MRPAGVTTKTFSDVHMHAKVGYKDQWWKQEHELNPHRDKELNIVTNVMKNPTASLQRIPRELRMDAHHWRCAARSRSRDLWVMAQPCPARTYTHSLSAFLLLTRRSLDRHALAARRRTERPAAIATVSRRRTRSKKKR